MEVADLILLIIIGGFGLFGLWFGLVHTLGSLMGTILGAYLASRYYDVMAGWLMNLTGWEGNFPKVLMFIVAFILINRLVGILFVVVDKILSIFTKMPGIRGLNHILGMVLGFFEGAITIGLIIFFIERFPLSEVVMGHLAGSVIAPYLEALASILVPLLPEALRLLHSTVDYVEGVFTENVVNVLNR